LSDEIADLSVFAAGLRMAGCAALVLAGGSGVRFGGDTPKQYLPLGGRAVLRRAAGAFASHGDVDAVRVVIRGDDRALYDAAFAGLDILEPVSGGASRQESARLGLESLDRLDPEFVLIHDGARPFVPATLIDDTIAALADVPAAVPALALGDTLKRADETGMVSGTVDRAGLWRAQTPQGFRYRDIRAAHAAARDAELTDDAAVAEQAGLPVRLVAGSADNIKITTAEDMAGAERRLTAVAGLVRVGTGFDVHRFGAGDHVMLCGVVVPHDRGLEGHSDADVGLHAITDAVLGTISEGDIGSHFPPSDAQWRDADSEVFLRHAAELVARRGGIIDALDVTLICEQPRIGPHREAMRRRIADIAGVAPSAVSVKASTTEGLGFTGRGEGIAAQAVATVRLAS
jgi:2-C-methyl-D-erythritol 4-phosphate cytidylyltransferase/2-C-methyl-D-erythritol 2,4-cyclodiphosphate synthase